MLRERIQSPVLAGRLRVDEGRASGMVFTLLETPTDEGDAGLSDATRKAVIAAVLTDGPAPEQPSLAPVATTLRASLPGASGLTKCEWRPLAKWLDHYGPVRLVKPSV